MHSERKVKGLLGWAVAGLVGLVGVYLSLKGSQQVAQGYEHYLRQEFADEAGDHYYALVSRLETYSTFLSSLRALFVSSQDVERDEFGKFARLVLERHYGANSGIQALEWVPRVRQAERAEHERAARAGGLPRYAILEAGPSGGLVPAGERPAYAPVFYIEPMAGNEPALGFDLASHPARRVTLERARDTGRTVSTDKLRLVQERGTQPGFLVVTAHYDVGDEQLETVSDRQQHLAGYLLMVLRAGDVLASALKPHASDGLTVSLLDPKSPPGERLLYTYPADAPRSAGPAAESRGARGGVDFQVTNRLEVFGKTWEVVVAADRERYAAKVTNPAGYYLAFGLLLSALVPSLVWVVFRLRGKNEALRESEADYRRLVDRAPDVVYSRSTKRGDGSTPRGWSRCLAIPGSTCWPIRFCGLSRFIRRTGSGWNRPSRPPRGPRRSMSSIGCGGRQAVGAGCGTVRSSARPSRMRSWWMASPRTSRSGRPRKRRCASGWNTNAR
jgi:CHASE1-domain containing sensor protein